MHNTRTLSRQYHETPPIKDIEAVDTNQTQDVECNRWGRVPECALEAKLTPSQFRLYCFIASYSDKNGISHVKRQRIMAEMGSDKARISKDIRALEDECLLRAVSMPKMKGQRRQMKCFHLTHHQSEPFARIKFQDILNRDIKSALSVLALLSIRARETDMAWPTQSEMAGDLGVTERTVRNRIAVLIEAGKIEVGRDGFDRNFYRIIENAEMTKRANGPESLDNQAGKFGQPDRKISTPLYNQTPFIRHHVSELFARDALAADAAHDGDADFEDDGFGVIELIPNPQTLEPRRAQPATIYKRPAGPMTVFQIAKEALLDLMQIEELRLTTNGLAVSAERKLLDAKLEAVGITAWLEQCAQLRASPEPHRGLTTSELLDPFFEPEKNKKCTNYRTREEERTC